MLEKESQFHVVGIFAAVYEKTATLDKAVNGFRATGLWPFNDNVFTDEDFAAANLTEEEPNPAPANTSTGRNANETASVPNTIMTSTTTDNDELSEPPQSPQPGTSKANEILVSICSPPKPKQKRERKRKAEKANVITSSPYKAQLLEKKSPKIPCSKKVTKKKSKKAPTPVSSEDEEWPCLVCAEPFANSRPLEKWIQCMSCRNWAHEACTPGTAQYICQSCESDS